MKAKNNIEVKKIKSDILVDIVWSLTKYILVDILGPFPSSFGEKEKVKVRVELNLHEIVNVQSASVSIDPCPLILQDYLASITF